MVYFYSTDVKVEFPERVVSYVMVVVKNPKMEAKLQVCVWTKLVYSSIKIIGLELPRYKFQLTDRYLHSMHLLLFCNLCLCSTPKLLTQHQSNPFALTKLHAIIVHPVLEYSCAVWDSHLQKDKKLVRLACEICNKNCMVCFL